MLRVLISACLAAGCVLGSAAAQTPRAKMTIATGVDPTLSTFYIAKTAGIFEKNGLDVVLNTGPSGSGMVPLLVQNQVDAVLAGEQAGITTFGVDHNVVTVAQTSVVGRYLGVVGRNIASLDALKGKKVGVPVGSAGDVFWRALIAKLGLDVRDYKVVPIDPPEMLAALDRGNLDAVVAWEPWETRILTAVPNTTVLRDNEGIIANRDFLYMNRAWIDKHQDAADRFMRSMAEATDFINKNPEEAAKQVAGFLKLDLPLTRTLMGKVHFAMSLDNDSVAYLKEVATQLKSQGRLPNVVDWNMFIYPDIARHVFPESVHLDATP